MAVVGSLVGIDASPLRIVKTAQKNRPKEAAVTIGPMNVDTVLGRKSSGAIHRAKKPTMITRASSRGGRNATPALSGRSASVLCVEFNNFSPVSDNRLPANFCPYRPARIQYGSEGEKGKGVILKRVHPRALMADIARGVGERGRLSGPVLVAGSALDRDSPAARCGKDRRERHTAMTGRRWFRDKKTNKVGPMVGERQQNY